MKKLWIHAIVAALSVLVVVYLDWLGTRTDLYGLMLMAVGVFLVSHLVGKTPIDFVALVALAVLIELQVCFFVAPLSEVIVASAFVVFVLAFLMDMMGIREMAKDVEASLWKVSVPFVVEIMLIFWPIYLYRTW